MVEEGRNGEPPDRQEPVDERPLLERSHSSGVIFILVALALILAIAFFYMTRERERKESEVVTDAVESVDSAARVVGDAAENAANQLSN